MTQSKSLKRTPRLAAAAIALLLCLGILLSGVHSTWTQAASKHGGHAHNAKLAPDLQQMLKDGSHDGRVRVIVQPAGAWSGGLDSELKDRGASVKSSFKNFASRAVEMKADDVEKLAERDDVAYVTPDRQVKLLGYVSLTSGTDAAAARFCGGALGSTGRRTAAAALTSALLRDDASCANTRSQGYSGARTLPVWRTGSVNRFERSQGVNQPPSSKKDNVWKIVGAVPVLPLEQGFIARSPWFGGGSLVRSERGFSLYLHRSSPGWGAGGLLADRSDRVGGEQGRSSAGRLRLAVLRRGRSGLRDPCNLWPSVQ